MTSFSNPGSAISTASSGKVFSNLGRDLMQNNKINDSRFYTAFGPASFHTSFSNKNNMPLQTVNEVIGGKIQLNNGIRMQNNMSEIGYSPFKAFQNRQ